jgi:thiamine-phosphate pyrophosphorylase
MNSLSRARLYGILDTGYFGQRPIEFYARAFIDGGVDIAQLRAKKESPDEILDLAQRVLPLLRAAGIPLIINDYPELAARVGADGVHVGQDDLSVSQARELAASQEVPQPLVGLSTHSLEQAQAAVRHSPDYIGFGPLFATPTKPDYTPIGLEQIGAVHQTVALPIFCIGGVNPATLDQVLAAGAQRVVVVSALLTVPDPTAVIREVKARLTL